MSTQTTKRSKVKQENSPVAVSIKLVLIFINVAMNKGYLTKDQCKEILHDMALPLSIEV